MAGKIGGRTDSTSGTKQKQRRSSGVLNDPFIDALFSSQGTTKNQPIMSPRKGRLRSLLSHNPTASGNQAKYDSHNSFFTSQGKGHMMPSSSSVPELRNQQKYMPATRSVCGGSFGAIKISPSTASLSEMSTTSTLASVPPTLLTRGVTLPDAAFNPSSDQSPSSVSALPTPTLSRSVTLPDMGNRLRTEQGPSRRLAPPPLVSSRSGAVPEIGSSFQMIQRGPVDRHGVPVVESQDRVRTVIRMQGVSRVLGASTDGRKPKRSRPATFQFQEKARIVHWPPHRLHYPEVQHFQMLRTCPHPLSTKNQQHHHPRSYLEVSRFQKFGPSSKIPQRIRFDPHGVPAVRSLWL